MHYVKTVAMILLAVWLILIAIADLSGVQLPSFANFVLGLIAVVSGILMLLGIREFLCCEEERSD